MRAPLHLHQRRQGAKLTGEAPFSGREFEPFLSTFLTNGSKPRSRFAWDSAPGWQRNIFFLSCACCSCACCGRFFIFIEEFSCSFLQRGDRKAGARHASQSRAPGQGQQDGDDQTVLPVPVFFCLPNFPVLLVRRRRNVARNVPCTLSSLACSCAATSRIRRSGRRRTR